MLTEHSNYRRITDYSGLEFEASKVKKLLGAEQFERVAARARANKSGVSSTTAWAYWPEASGASHYLLRYGAREDRWTAKLIGDEVGDVHHNH